MIVVADTGPVNYLILSGLIDLAHDLFGILLIPPAVHRIETSSTSTRPFRSFEPPRFSFPKKSCWVRSSVTTTGRKNHTTTASKPQNRTTELKDDSSAACNAQSVAHPGGGRKAQGAGPCGLRDRAPCGPETRPRSSASVAASLALKALRTIQPWDEVSAGRRCAARLRSSH